MALQGKVSKRAAAQIRKADDWWFANRPLAPGAIAIDLKAGLSLVSESPSIGTAYPRKRTVGVRRLYLSRLGYFVYYNFSDAELTVLAFWHASRRQGPRL
jgi:plasmid stabilization system protein ParE